MTEHQPFGSRLRRGRLSARGDGRMLIVPLDHSVANGPLAVADGLNSLVGDLAASGADAVVLHKGTLRQVDPGHFAWMSLIVHLSASTRHAPDPDAKYLVSTVENAVRSGADAVSVHVNLGSLREDEQIADLARTAESCDRWSIPLLAMVYARGPQIGDPTDPELLAHTAALAADLGADIVKIAHPGSDADLADIVRGCPIPVVVAGGPPLPDAELLAMTGGIVRSGAAGVAMGRNIFCSPRPAELTRRLAEVVHDRHGLTTAGALDRVG